MPEGMNELPQGEPAGGTTVAEPPVEGQTQGQSPAEGQPNGRTYTDREVSEIVQKRLKDWTEFGKPDELRARLNKAQQIEQWWTDFRQRSTQTGMPPGLTNPNQPELSDQDKQVRAYLEKLYPGLSKQAEREKQLTESVNRFDQFRYQTIAEKNRSFLKVVAEKDGYKPEHFDMLENQVAASILANHEDFNKYLMTGDPMIVKKHYDAINQWLTKNFRQPPANPAAAGAARAASGARTANLPPRLPPGGVPAPTSKQGKLSDQQRRDAAFARINESGD